MYEENKEKIIYCENDASIDTFKLYSKIYCDDKIKDKYNIENPIYFKYKSPGVYVNEKDNCERLYALPIDVKEEYIKTDEFEGMGYRPVKRLSGDCFFNLNETKIDMLLEICEYDEKISAKIKSLKKNHHCIYNMVLLQTVGNVQTRKQKGIKLDNVEYENLDRGDTFLYLLDNFYKDKEKLNSEILKCSSSANKETLKNYLEEFEDVYEYAKIMLNLEVDKAFINRMIYSGSKKLYSKDSVNEYLDIAIEFWEKRKERIDSIIKNEL